LNCNPFSVAIAQPATLFAIDHLQTLEEIRDEIIAPQRLNATLIGLFAGLALAIAAVDVAGVLTFSVSQCTNEFGIRVAPGAERGTILLCDCEGIVSARCTNDGAAVRGAGVEEMSYRGRSIDSRFGLGYRNS
jgi:hypothetical protein